MIVGRAALCAGVFAGAGLGISFRINFDYRIDCFGRRGWHRTGLSGHSIHSEDSLISVHRYAGHVGALRGAAKGLGDNQPVYPTDLDYRIHAKC